MRGNDRLILVVLPLLVLAVGFWVLVLGPKQKEASELQDKVGTLQAEVDSAEAEIATSEQARDAFPKNYADLVALGTAVPEDDDQSTLIQSFTELGRQNSLNFRSFAVVPGSGAAPPAPATTPAPGDPTATSPPDETTTVSAPATEASAAVLPIGATVGPAGLPVTPYELSYKGRFFDLASLFGDLTSSVDVGSQEAGTTPGEPRIHGRLLTIDGFDLEEDSVAGFPRLTGTLNVNTYLVPADQGISAGATPAGPAPVGSTEAPAVSTTDSTATAPTAAVSP